MPKFRCKTCGYIVNQKSEPFKCVSCGSISSFEDIFQEDMKSSKKSLDKSKITRLKEVELTSDDRIISGISEVDRVMGGGFVSDSVNIITAPPGQGKSTLILEIANALAKKGKIVLYISSEESAKQIKRRADRVLSNDINDNLYIKDTKETNDIELYFNALKPDAMIIDSVSSFRSTEIASPAGSITQVRKCSDMVISLCKGGAKDCMALMIAHVTKDDELSGARSLEHDVDAVMYLEGERDEELRVLRTIKNRFGELDTGLFIMCEEGLKELNDPSEYFTTKRDSNDTVSGVALSMVKEGSRMITVEIEVLISKCFMNYPTRIASCLRKDNFNTLLSIIEQNMGIQLYNYNAVINATGGIKLSNTSTDLAVIMSVLSAYKKKAIENGVVFIGEVGLTGELKRTQGIEKSLKELDRLKYKKAYVPKGNYRVLSQLQNIEIIECKDIKDVAKKCGIY